MILLSLTWSEFNQINFYEKKVHCTVFFILILFLFESHSVQIATHFPLSTF